MIYGLSMDWSIPPIRIGTWKWMTAQPTLLKYTSIVFPLWGLIISICVAQIPSGIKDIVHHGQRIPTHVAYTVCFVNLHSLLKGGLHVCSSSLAYPHPDGSTNSVLPAISLNGSIDSIPGINWD